MPPEAAIPPETRTGIGYDSHRFGPPRPLILGGVTIPFDRGLIAHSDGDAIAHAVTDAVLGACGAGDIGELYPDSDAANKGRSSLEMLGNAVQRISAERWSVANVDITVIAEQPRIGPHRADIRQALGAVLRIPADRVSVKGKSNEGMGWIGRGEGIACIAVATLTRIPE